MISIDALSSTAACWKPHSQRRRGLDEQLDGASCRMGPHQSFLMISITWQRWHRIQMPWNQETSQQACQRNAAAPTVHSRQVYCHRAWLVVGARQRAALCMPGRLVRSKAALAVVPCQIAWAS